MKTVLSGVAVAMAAALLAAPAADAQEGSRPARSLAVGVDASPTIGVWTRVSPRADVGVEVELDRFSEDHDDDFESTSTRFSVAPGLKLYTRAGGAVAPYLFAGVRFAHEKEEMGDLEADQTSYGADLGFGLEWFAAERLSIGGHVGLRATRIEGTQVVAPSTDVDVEGWQVGTLNSGIRIHFYF